MPGKKKKTRKPEKKGGKSAHKSGLVQRSNDRVSHHTGVKPSQTKVFSLKDEAAKSTFRSSKRLWQGDGQKLRNLPVEFIKALEHYDPGKYLREQLEANALRHHVQVISPEAEEAVSLHATEEPDVDLATGEYTRSDKDHLSALDVAAVDESGIDIAPLHLSSMNSDRVSKETSDNTEMDSIDMEDIVACTDEIASATKESEPHEFDSTSSTDEEISTANIDLVLGVMERDDILESESTKRELDRDTPSVMLEETSEMLSSSETELYFVDVEGDANITPEPISDSQETILFQPRNNQAKLDGSLRIPTTPWARTIDDPVIIDETVMTSSLPLADDVLENSKTAKGRKARRGKAKQGKQYKGRRVSRQDDIDIMFDYMENARWTDEEDIESDTFMSGEAEPVITQILAGLDGIQNASDDEAEVSASDQASDSDGSEDDTDIDDDLELMIDAEMEELEFDLGYSGGCSANGRRSGADRELQNHVLYHEDYNVYDYDSTDDEIPLAGLHASGARKRGLNKMIDNLDLSDEELEATLIAQWKKDRGSKKEKKRERQRLHMNGLIGKKAKRAQASHAVDTTSANELDGYHVHIKRFVSHADYVGIEELPMPAMGKPVRRAVHLLCQAYGLKTASQGSGKRRHIILYKTKHAMQLPDSEYLQETLLRAKRGLGVNSKYRDTLLPESARLKLGRSGKPMKSGGRDGGGGGGRLRDGDIVGADAPEIHVSNRGRQMLEKLGWLHGSGLGAEGKEGMNLPLFATIKNTKHGLQ